MVVVELLLTDYDTVSRFTLLYVDFLRSLDRGGRWRTWTEEY